MHAVNRPTTKYLMEKYPGLDKKTIKDAVDFLKSRHKVLTFSDSEAVIRGAARARREELAKENVLTKQNVQPKPKRQSVPTPKAPSVQAPVAVAPAPQPQTVEAPMRPAQMNLAYLLN